MEKGGTTQLIKVFIPDAKTQKCIVLDTANTVWVAKQVILDKVYKELPRDPLNYGVYMPPSGTGKLGKFLDDTLLLSNYALAGNIPRLEMRYKSRDYTKQISLNEKSIIKVNSKANQKKLVEYVLGSHHKKIDKLLDAGLDPNFVTEDGNTPLGIACGRGRSVQCIQSLLGGGAHIDFRGKDGLTPMHRGAIGGNATAINILLSYGASPNYRDSKELTPLYHTAIMGDDTGACITLLRNRAELGIKDQGGWSELHHTSKYGHVAHAELFIRYGANINDQNLVGNTPLHVASSHGQRDCALMLLKRGADRTCTNFSGQTPSQVSILCGHHHLASEINDFSPSEIDLKMLKPDYNEKARQFAPRLLNKTESSMTLPSAEKIVDTLTQEWDDDPPVPEEDIQVSKLRKSSVRPGSGSSHASSTRPLPDVESLNSVDVSSTHSGSEPGTPSMGTPIMRKQSFGQQRERLYRAGPGRYIAVQDVEPQQDGDIPLRRGVAVEVTYIGKGGYWEGKAGGLEGWFPRLAIKEMGEEQYDYHAPSESPATPSGRKPSSSRVTNIRDVIINRGNRGFGFAMRGVRATTTMQFTPTPEVPALQYVGSVEEGGAAEEAGLIAGDFIIEVNGHNVTHSTHDEVVAIVRKAGNSLRMKVITPSVKPKSVSKQMQSQITPVSTPEAVRKEPAVTEEAPPLTKVYNEPADRETVIGFGETSIGRTDSPLVAGFEPTGWDSSQDDEVRSYSPNFPRKPMNKSVSLMSYSKQMPAKKTQTLPQLPAKDYPKLEEFAGSSSSADEESTDQGLSAFEIALRQNKQKIDRKSLTPDMRRERANTLPEKNSPLVVRKTAVDSPSLMNEQILLASKARMERAENNQVKMSPRSSPNPLRQNSLAMAISSKIDTIVKDGEKQEEKTTPQKVEPKPVKKPPPVTKPKPQRNVSTTSSSSPGSVDWRSNLKPASPLIRGEVSKSNENLPKPLPSSGNSIDLDSTQDEKRPSSFIELEPPIGFSLDHHDDSEGEEFIPPPLPQSSPPPTTEAGTTPDVFIFPEQKSPSQSSPITTPKKLPASQSLELPSPIPSPPSSPGGLDISSVVPPPEFSKRSPWSPASDDTPPPLPSEPPPLELDTRDNELSTSELVEDTPPPRPPTPNGYKASPVKIQNNPTTSVAPETSIPPATGFQTITTPKQEAGPPDETKVANTDIHQTSNAKKEEAGFETKELADWTVTDVSDWLKEIKLGEYAEAFEENEIIGEHLVDISKEDLKELGVKKLGHQKTILSKVAILLK